MLYAVLHNPQYPDHHDHIFAYSDRRQHFISMGHPDANTTPLDEDTITKLTAAADNVHSIIPAIASGDPTVLFYRVYGGDAELLGDCHDIRLIQLDGSHLEISPNQGTQIHIHTHTSLMQMIASTVKYAAGVSFAFAGFTLSAPTAVLLALTGAMPFSDTMIERLFGQPVTLGNQAIMGTHTDIRNALQDLHPVPEFFTAGSVVMMLIGAAMLGFGSSWPVALFGCVLLATPVAYSALATVNNKYAVRYSIDLRVQDAPRAAGTDPAALEAAGVDTGNAAPIQMAVVADPSPLLPRSRGRSRLVQPTVRPVTAHDEAQLPRAERDGGGNPVLNCLRNCFFPTIHDARRQTLEQALRDIRVARAEAHRLGVVLNLPQVAPGQGR
jgi:hypothetical protein